MNYDYSYDYSYMVGKLQESRNLEFGNPKTSSIYHKWRLKFDYNHDHEPQHIIFEPLRDEAHVSVTGYPPIDYPHKKVIVNNIKIPSVRDLIDMGINKDIVVNHYKENPVNVERAEDEQRREEEQGEAERTISRLSWYTATKAGLDNSDGIPIEQEGGLYLVLVEGVNHKYIMATDEATFRNGMLEEYANMLKEMYKESLSQKRDESLQDYENRILERHKVMSREKAIEDRKKTSDFKMITEYTNIFMVGKLQKSGKLEFGNPLTSSIYHKWTLKFDFYDVNRLHIIFEPPRDETHFSVTGYPHKMVSVDNITIPSSNELIGMGIDKDIVNQKYKVDADYPTKWENEDISWEDLAKTGRWFTKSKAGSPQPGRSTLHSYGEGYLYLVLVEGHNNEGNHKYIKYIMATWSIIDRHELLENYKKMKNDTDTLEKSMYKSSRDFSLSVLKTNYNGVKLLDTFNPIVFKNEEENTIYLYGLNNRFHKIKEFTRKIENPSRIIKNPKLTFFEDRSYIASPKKDNVFVIELFLSHADNQGIGANGTSSRVILGTIVESVRDEMFYYLKDLSGNQHDKILAGGGMQFRSTSLGSRYKSRKVKKRKSRKNKKSRTRTRKNRGFKKNKKTKNRR